MLTNLTIVMSNNTKIHDLSIKTVLDVKIGAIWTADTKKPPDDLSGGFALEAAFRWVARTSYVP
jgi:ABC-type transporter Mla maintaining outer membrane lipid asymmetry ATPase subunit MlaF